MMPTNFESPCKIEFFLFEVFFLIFERKMRYLLKTQILFFGRGKNLGEAGSRNLMNLARIISNFQEGKVIFR
jgi:hypothetical protein